jgi:hypothetical protein
VCLFVVNLDMFKWLSCMVLELGSGLNARTKINLKIIIINLKINFGLGRPSALKHLAIPRSVICTNISSKYEKTIISMSTG